MVRRQTDGDRSTYNLQDVALPAHISHQILDRVDKVVNLLPFLLPGEFCVHVDGQRAFSVRRTSPSFLL